MLRALILLLSLLLAVPAGAVPGCHDDRAAMSAMPMPTASAGHYRHDAPPRTAPAHECLGCIAGVRLSSAGAEPIVADDAVRHPRFVAAALPVQRGPPLTPPPRPL